MLNFLSTLKKGLNTGLLIPLLFGSDVVFPFFFPETVSTMKAINGLNCRTMRGTPTQFIGKHRLKLDDFFGLILKFIMKMKRHSKSP